MKKKERPEKKEMAKKRGQHVGGPGRPDYINSDGKRGEVKATKRPVNRDTVEKLVVKKIEEIESKRGFTKPAKEYAAKKNVALRMRGKKI